MRSLHRNILAGLITVGPLFVTWLVFSFLLDKLVRAGQPLVYGLQTMYPEAWLRRPWMQSVLAVVLTLLVLFVPPLVANQLYYEHCRKLIVTTRARFPERTRQLGEYMASLPPDRFPSLLALGPLLGSGDGERRFLAAIDLVIAGIEVLAARSSE